MGVWIKIHLWVSGLKFVYGWLVLDASMGVWIRIRLWVSGLGCI